jgi:hypothetical protein
MGGVLANILGGNALGGVASIINAIKGKNPEDAAKLQELLEKHQDAILAAQVAQDQAQRDENVSLNSIAGQNVRADAQSGDKFTGRARPAVIWVGLGIMAWNYVVVPMMAIHFKIQIVTFPDMFWETWGVVATGVVMTRTADKLFGGAGGSVQAFGMKAESKGD